MKYFLKAAGNSLRDSNIQIGNHFVTGRGVNANPRKALEWYYKANRYHDRVKDFEDDGIYLTEDEKKKTIFQLINETEDIMKRECDAREETLQIRLGLSLRKEQELLADSQQKQQKVELMEKQTVNLIKMNSDFITSSQLRQQNLKAVEDKLKAALDEKQELLTLSEQRQQKIESIEDQLATLLKEKEQAMTESQQKDQKIEYIQSEKQTLDTENQALKQSLLRLEQQLRDQNSLQRGVEHHHQTSSSSSSSSSASLDFQLKEKDSMIRMLTRENELSQQASSNYQQASETTIDTFRSLVRSKDNEIDLLKSNTQALLDKEIVKYTNLEKAYHELKRGMREGPVLLVDYNDSNSITNGTVHSRIESTTNSESNVKIKMENELEDSLDDSTSNKKRRVS
ncbi:hypothetical protein K501DRAFT_83754 [Backusella circina FSU 941]|nr:hypothetical protein K501DRAFT_83754 [Backusella circina FSU 941]